LVELAVDHLLGFNPSQPHFQVRGDAAVEQRFVERLVGVFVTDVLADDADRHLVDRMLDLVDEIFPIAQRFAAVRKVQELHDDLVDAFGRQRQGHLVDRIHVARGDHGVFGDVAEERDLPLDLLRDRPVAAA
jgi:hypothetical protein